MSIIRFPKLLLAIVLTVTAAAATATTLSPNPMLDISGLGLKLETGGAGLEGGAGTITVTIDGPVVTAILYWAGRDFPCSQDGGGNCLISGADDELLFDGTAVTADRIVGTEVNDANFPNKTNNIGYAADVTGLVAPKGTGTHSFAVAVSDVDALWVLDGAGLLIVYTDSADTDFHRVIVYEGLDFAFINSPSPAAAKVTELITISYDSADTVRVGQVMIFAGDAEAGRPDTIRIDGNPIFNDLDSDEGAAYDVDSFGITIPALATGTTLQLFSETNALTTTPDSLLWEVAALQLPIPMEEGALGRMTGGRNIQVDGAKIGGARGGMTIHCDITLSNNIQVTWGRGQTGNKWHLDKPITSAICIDDPLIDPTPPRAPFDTFIGEGVGRLNNVDGSAIRFTFIDAGEPGTSDYMEISIWHPGDDPDTDPVYFSAAGFLVGGNIQAHFDQPHNGNGK